MVLWNGTVVWANASHHRDLHWASCGGGGGLGVVTEFKIRLNKLPVPVFAKVDISGVVPERYIEFQQKVQGWWASEPRRYAGGGSPLGPTTHVS